MLRNGFNAALCNTLLGFLLVAFWPNSSMGELRDINVKGKAPADYVASQIGKDWAVVIGIDDYQHVPRLQYAVRDAQGIAEVLKNQGFQVTALYNDRATRHAILKELGSNLIDKVKPEDRVLVFYAGHGETWGVDDDRKMGYLVPVEGQQDALVATGISMGHIRELANILPARNVLFLMDVCYGGIAGQRFRSLSPLTEAYIKVITREPGRQLITAGGADQQAIEGPEWGHSVFTHYLIEGLGKGLADLNDDGVIPASELYAYLDQRVYTAAQLIGHTQRPELWSLSAEKGEFVFLGQTAEEPKAQQSKTDEGTEAREVAKLRDEVARLQSQLEQLTVSDVEAVEAPQAESKPDTDDLSLNKDSDRILAVQKACDRGEADGCFQLASLYVLGKGVTRDLSRGATLFEKGCRSGHKNSCTALGSLYWMGSGVSEDRKLAIALWKHACKGGNSKACDLLRKAGGTAG